MKKIITVRIALFLSFLFITSCDLVKNHSYEIKILEGSFITPLGTYKIINKHSRKEYPSIREVGKNLQFRASDEEVSIIIHATLPRGHIRYPLNQDEKIVIGHFKHNSAKFPLELKNPSTKKNNIQGYQKYSLFVFKYQSSPRGKWLNIAEERAKVKHNESKVRHIVMEFSLDGKPYIFEVKFKIVIDTEYSLGHPPSSA